MRRPHAGVILVGRTCARESPDKSARAPSVSLLEVWNAPQRLLLGTWEGSYGKGPSGAALTIERAHV